MGRNDHLEDLQRACVTVIDDAEPACSAVLREFGHEVPLGCSPADDEQSTRLRESLTHHHQMLLRTNERFRLVDWNGNRRNDRQRVASSPRRAVHELTSRLQILSVG